MININRPLYQLNGTKIKQVSSISRLDFKMTQDKMVFYTETENLFNIEPDIDYLFMQKDGKYTVWSGAELVKFETKKISNEESILVIPLYKRDITLFTNKDRYHRFVFEEDFKKKNTLKEKRSNMRLDWDEFISYGFSTFTKKGEYTNIVVINTRNRVKIVSNLPEQEIKRVSDTFKSRKFFKNRFTHINYVFAFDQNNMAVLTVDYIDIILEANKLPDLYFKPNYMADGNIMKELKYANQISTKEIVKGGVY